MVALDPPFINVEGLANLRDIGGYQISPKSTVRKGLFFRAADPCKVDSKGILQLRDDLGISAIYDIRAKQEIDRNVNTDGDVAAWEYRIGEVNKDSRSEIKRFWVPVFEEEDYGPEAVAIRFRNYAEEGTQGFAKAYEQIMDNGKPCFAKIFRHVATRDPSKPNQGVLIHCSAGKDRTGVFAALLLSLLGVDDNTVAEEYTLTEIGLKEQKPMFIERLMTNPAFSEPGGPGLEGAQRMTTCTKENMLATLAMMRRNYGSAEEYVTKACGLSKEELEAIKKVMTVESRNGTSTL